MDAGAAVDAAIDAARTAGVTGLSFLSRRPGAGECARVSGVVARVVPGAAPGAMEELAERDREPVAGSTVFDIASVSKLFTAVVVVRLAQERLLDLDAPLARMLPGARAGEVTTRDLLTHTAGLPPTVAPWLAGNDLDDRRAHVLQVAPRRPRRSGHEYSCVGFVLAGFVAERAGGCELDQLVAEIIGRPLGLDTLGYRPTDPMACAATEIQDGLSTTLDRGLVRGEVHDECAWSLGGVAGNAGLFGSAEDLVRFGEMLAGGGSRAGATVLSEAAVHDMVADHLGGIPGPGFGQGLGLRRGHAEMMGTDKTTTVGHPGFTGTNLVIDLRGGRVTAILSNAVHPRRGMVDRASALRPLVLAARGLG